MRIHTYVIDHDLGFAPNPFHGVCTLAACKPQIRRYAVVGDYVLGTGSKPRQLQGHLIFWMKVDEILHFDQYWKDVRFRRKRPMMVGSRMQRYGDNIYYKDENGAFRQVDSFHSEPDGSVSVKNLKRDTATTDRVLIGYDYAYWGREAPKVPTELTDFVHSTQGHRSGFQQDRIDAVLTWLRERPERGLIGRPIDWPD